MFFFFFFQAEDGIRDYKVTGVQTCALPICAADLAGFDQRAVAPVHGGAVGRCNATAAAADDDVVVVLHGDSVLCLSGPNAAAGHLALFAGQGPAAGGMPGSPRGSLRGAAAAAALWADSERDGW